MKPQVAYAIAACLLVSSTIVMHQASRAEQTPERLTFAAFPLEIANQWQGRELGLEPDVLEVLRVDDYMMRIYVPSAQARGRVTAGRAEHASGEASRSVSETTSLNLERRAPTPAPGVPVWLYIGYYKSQRTGVTYHSPLNCLPGSGWSILSRDEVALDGRRVNRVVIQKGLDRQLILYWYQDRGRVIASEYWAKAYLLWDAMTQNRTDGALVRISVPIVSSEGSADAAATEAAFAAGESFVQHLVTILPAFLPV